jgi:DNA-binding transcriptional ArsR family regulator
VLKCELVELFGAQEENIEIAVQSLKVLSHPARLRIMRALRDGEQTVQNLEYYTGIRQTTFSQHLSLLKSRGVLVSRRQATYSFYRMSNKKIIDLFDMTKNVYCT